MGRFRLTCYTNTVFATVPELSEATTYMTVYMFKRESSLYGEYNFKNTFKSTTEMNIPDLP
jgi:hypothetical protein